MIDYFFDITENVGDVMVVVYAFAISTVLSVTEGVTFMPGWNADGTPLFAFTDQFISAGGTSITWAAALTLITAVGGLALTQGMEFFNPQRLREGESTLEEVLEWVVGIGTIGIPFTVAFDLGGVKSTVTGDPHVALVTFTIVVLAYVYLIDKDRWY